MIEKKAHQASSRRVVGSKQGKPCFLHFVVCIFQKKGINKTTLFFPSYLHNIYIILPNNLIIIFNNSINEKIFDSILFYIRTKCH